VVQVAQDPALAGPAAAERRRQEIQRIVETLFDLPEMTRRSLGRHWTDRTAQEREEFTRLFKGILEHLYFGKIESYSGQRMQYLNETPATKKFEGLADAGTANPFALPRLHPGSRSQNPGYRRFPGDRSAVVVTRSRPGLVAGWVLRRKRTLTPSLVGASSACGNQIDRWC